MLAFEIFVFVFIAESFCTIAFIQDDIIHVEKAVEHFNSFANTSWKAHHNNLPTHVPLSHLKSQLGVLPEKKEYSYDEHHHPNSELPVNYDCRKAFPHCSSIFSIVDQSNCESCWAVSTAAVLSDRFCIQSNGTINVTLSSANLLSCNKDNDGCGGGVMAEAWKYVKEHGLVTGGGYGSFEGCQPYPIAPKSDIRHREDIPQAITPKCHKDHCSNKRYRLRKEHTYKTSKTIRLPCDEEKIRREIYHHGSVTAGMQIFLSFLFYNTGIYKSHADEELVGLHAVRLIGWGEELGVRYWIGANSWGRQWGENGFFKILRGRDHCGIESMVHAGQPIIEEHLKLKAPK